MGARNRSHQSPQGLGHSHQASDILCSCIEELIVSPWKTIDLDLWSGAGDGVGDGMLLQTAIINLRDREVQGELLKKYRKMKYSLRVFMSVLNNNFGISGL